MFIKCGDGKITNVIKTTDELTEEQKSKTEKLAKDLSHSNESKKKDN